MIVCPINCGSQTIRNGVLIFHFLIKCSTYKNSSNGILHHTKVATISYDHEPRFFDTMYRILFVTHAFDRTVTNVGSLFSFRFCSETPAADISQKSRGNDFLKAGGQNFIFTQASFFSVFWILFHAYTFMAYTLLSSLILSFMRPDW